MLIQCYAAYCNLVQHKALYGLSGFMMLIVHDKKQWKCRWTQLQGLCPTAWSMPSSAGLALPALLRRPAGWSPRLLPRLLPGPCPVALQRALIHLHHVRLLLFSAGHLLTALQSGPVAPLPPPRVWVWTRSKMEGCVNPGAAHAVGPQPRHLAQVVLYSIYLVICRVKMQNPVSL